VDLDALKGQAGFLLPTDTFQGRASFSVGEEDFELIEAHGETHDMLIVWLPKQKVLLPGDNYYRCVVHLIFSRLHVATLLAANFEFSSLLSAFVPVPHLISHHHSPLLSLSLPTHHRAFPNLYTIRGTTPRPVRAWIQSLDTMRKLEPEYLVPSHTEPVFGRETVSKQLTDYRDGIQWVYVETIRGANEGKSMDELASSVGLPLHLRDNDALDELYGQIDWSVRAIYSGELGWFDGQAEVRLLSHSTAGGDSLSSNMRTKSRLLLVRAYSQFPFFPPLLPSLHRNSTPSATKKNRKKPSSSWAGPPRS